MVLRFHSLTVKQTNGNQSMHLSMKNYEINSTSLIQLNGNANINKCTELGASAIKRYYEIRIFQISK